MEETTNHPEKVADWTFVCHNQSCLWIGKVGSVYSPTGQLLKCPGCGHYPKTNGFMADYSDYLKGKIKARAAHG